NRGREVRRSAAPTNPASGRGGARRGPSMTAMQCLVIMPFGEAFDPVFRAVRNTVAGAVPGQPIDCYWLKDVHAAGRITDDIVAGIQKAALCVSDVTRSNPNVMWETGYAMALG